MAFRRKRFDDFVRARVVVHLIGGGAVAGILHGVYDDSISIVSARLLEETRTDAPSPEDRASATPIDGEVLIPLDRIRFAQGGVNVSDVPTSGG